MTPHFLPSHFSFIVNLLLFLQFFFLIPLHVTSDSESYKSCAPFTCGSFTNITYPFWNINNQPSYCGHPNFTLDCQKNNLTIDISSQKFHIIGINQTSQLLKIARLDLWSYDAANVPSCPDTNVNLNLDFFKYTSNDENYTLLSECDPLPNDSFGSSSLSSEVSQQISCLIDSKPQDAYLVLSTKMKDFAVLDCKNDIQVYGPRSSIIEEFSDTVVNVIKEGFEVKWSGVDDDICNYCKKFGGRCGYNTTKSAFMCICPNQQSYGDCGFCRQNSTTESWPDESGCIGSKLYNSAAPSPLPASSYGDTPVQALVPLPSSNSDSKNSRGTSSSLNLKRKLIVGIAGSAVMVALLMCIIICYIKGKSSIQQLKFQFKTKNDKNIEAFFKEHGALTQKKYKFSEIKKMTNSFKIKLGQGGFGVVYKGKLFNGCPVAVKILNASKRNGEEFINEVASITRTSHVNVVSLIGFCFEGRKKALVYEFMSNGSLDKFIYNKGPETIESLSWDNLHQIAKGIARGLEYLHRGCTTRILHFDIKPHNILLDENFNPKISDFGLAKLCPRKESIISMSDQRGTMGYVAPEVWNRHFGGVSYKSDVYSFGMMLLEMVGGRKNINADASHTSEIYFPHWVYSRLEFESDLRPDGVMDTEEDEIARRMTIVGLWCIQTLPNDRPTMSKVVEMLEVSMNSLKVPPKPLLSSPTRSLSES
ncbi:LEAF RUST 10 DISEASE-RESISTANCE LOCUS RECEPTOR-LIKE PROTEIN KINASE-like 2.4 isoform X1 [Vicia villosa]|uniref:LEAF RUST 10 DISEASE-RESISTANCE LOCUS RECEPTOR-LIKE PROTEIN KINASE-like 2.4 isoform X1 n=1 Tax=Vicia villosa TaxID=3911 RepID=UPI00273C99B2|nr:LEAF RUST 10 DISEASE-RESISTANCE LOCUS RECEPTOR-LIKE PROTEIN KINASE-like 2.4 isoform X1 [Vicia villosa]